MGRGGRGDGYGGWGWGGWGGAEGAQWQHPGGQVDKRKLILDNHSLGKFNTYLVSLSVTQYYQNSR